MADYFTLIDKTISNLSDQTSEGRKTVYDRARTALLKQLRGMQPALSEKDITRERLALEEAIRKIEYNLINNKTTTSFDETIQNEPTPATPPIEPPQQDYVHVLPEVAEPVKEESQDYEPKGRVKFDHPPEEPPLKKYKKSIVIGGTVAGLLLASLATWFAFSSSSSIPTTPAKPIVEAPTPPPVAAPVEKKIDQRIAQDAPITQPKPAVTKPETAKPARDSRVIFFEETPGGTQQGIYSEGIVKWKTDSDVNPAIIGEFTIPDRKLKIVVKISQNKDKTLPASHLVEVDIAQGATLKVMQMPGFLMKAGEQTRGQPISAQAVKITDNSYLIGLSSIDADITRNVELIKEWAYLDFPVEFDNRKRAVITLEKGQDGDAAFSKAFTAWGQ